VTWKQLFCWMHFKSSLIWPCLIFLSPFTVPSFQPLVFACGFDSFINFTYAVFMKILATWFVKSSVSKIQVLPLHGTYNSGLHKVTFTALKFTYIDLEVNYIYSSSMQILHFLEWCEVHRYSTQFWFITTAVFMFYTVISFFISTGRPLLKNQDDTILVLCLLYNKCVLWLGVTVW